MPPISIYIPSDAQLSPPSFGIFKSVCWYGKFVFILVLSMRSVRQKKDAPCYARSIHWKEALAPGQFSNRAILSHTMTGNRHTSFVNRLNFKTCIIVYLTQSAINSYCTLSLPYGRTSLRLTRAESIGQTQSKVTVENRLSEIYKIWNLVGLQSLYAYSSQS